MKVTHIALGFPPDKGGIEYHVENLTRDLARRGIQISIVVPARNGYAGYEHYDDLRKVIRVPPLLRFRKLFLTPKLISLLMTNPPDLYHLHMPYYIGSEMIWLASIIKRRPLIVTYHSDYCGSVRVFRPLERLYNRVIVNLMLARAKRIIVTSWSYLISSRIAGSLWNKCIVIPYGVDQQKFNPDLNPTSVRESYRIGDNELLVLFVASLERGHSQKGLNYLLDAIRLAGNVVPNLKLMVVGDGELRPLYQAYARLKGVAEKVIWTGGIDNELLPEYYAASDIFVLPSTSRMESFGIVLIEAMACGKPVICSNLPGVKDKVTFYKVGITVPPRNPILIKDALVQLSHDEGLRRSMGRRGRQAVEENFSNQLIAEKTLKLYKECLLTLKQ